MPTPHNSQIPKPFLHNLVPNAKCGMHPFQPGFLAFTKTADKYLVGSVQKTGSAFTQPKRLKSQAEALQAELKFIEKRLAEVDSAKVTD